MDFFVYSVLFIFGTVIGSFLNVVADRLPQGRSILYPASHCEHCRHKLAWYDLIPVFSYIFLRGKCRYCHKEIGLFYPIVEVITGILFITTYVFLFHTGVIAFLFFLLSISLLIIIFFADFKYGLIPFPTIAIGCSVTLFYFVLYTTPDTFQNHIIASLGAFLFFLFLFVVTRGRGMGFGDVMLVLFMGLLLGYPNIIIALYMSFVIGALVSVLLIMYGKKKLRHDTIPFGPFLVSGTFIALYWGSYIMKFISQYVTL